LKTAAQEAVDENLMMARWQQEPIHRDLVDMGYWADVAAGGGGLGYLPDGPTHHQSSAWSITGTRGSSPWSGSHSTASGYHHRSPGSGDTDPGFDFGHATGGYEDCDDYPFPMDHIPDEDFH
jgi:hypothetical protein